MKAGILIQVCFFGVLLPCTHSQGVIGLSLEQGGVRGLGEGIRGLGGGVQGKLELIGSRELVVGLLRQGSFEGGLLPNPAGGEVIGGSKEKDELGEGDGEGNLEVIGFRDSWCHGIKLGVASTFFCWLVRGKMAAETSPCPERFCLAINFGSFKLSPLVELALRDSRLSLM